MRDGGFAELTYRTISEDITVVNEMYKITFGGYGFRVGVIL